MSAPGPWGAIRGWFQNTKREISQHGLSGALRSGRHLVFGITARSLSAIGKQVNFGEHVFDAEWDLLIILDACRYDLFAEVAPDYEFIKEVEPTYSIASGSDEWIKKTFSPERDSTFNNTAYITANPFASKNNLSHLAYVDNLWEWAWDEDLMTVPPRPLTDRTIQIGRKRTFDHVIVHYMQPHCPFVPDPIGAGLRQDATDLKGRNTVWKKLRDGRTSKEKVWIAYQANLHYVLEDVRILIENFDGEAVITSDHANALGEAGIYGHLNYIPTPAVKRVPWCEITAVDEHTHEPATYDRDKTDVGVENRLKALGYK